MLQVRGCGQGLRKVSIKGMHGALVVSSGMANTYRLPRIFNPFEIMKIEIIPK